MLDVAGHPHPCPETNSMNRATGDSNGIGTCRKCLKNRALCMGVVFALGCDVVASAALASDKPIYLLLCCLRGLVLVVSFILAVKIGTGAWTCGRCTSSNSHPEPLATPLCSSRISSCSHSNATSVVSRSAELDMELERHRASLELREQHSNKRNVVLGLCFLVMTAQSTYTGIHILSAERLSNLVTCCCMIAIVCMNTEFLLLKRLVDFMTDDEGVFLPGVHEHKLYYQKVAQFAWCKLCRERIGPKTGGPEGFKCKDCDGTSTSGPGPHGGTNFWICLPCYRKQQTKLNMQEGILRGDKGPKFTEQFTTWQYFCRALRLVQPFRHILWIAIVCVVLTQGAKVLMPKYQGSVINSIIQKDARSFAHELLTFVLLSVSSLLFGSVQSLAVEIIQRRITCDMRTVMFQSLIGQDIAFFDGVMTGQLTSRMTNDVAAVVQPVRQLMNTVFSNTLLLIGGLFMCLLTSWRLTVLASTMIGPVIYLTSIYANWSKGINLKIRVNMADANAIATEALRNIRTVRSFGADNIELTQFQRHMDQAKRSGMKDAYGTAGVAAATQYVDFAATILILWYGGMTVMREDEGWTSLTVGELVTFNLYWNLLNNAISGLNGMLNTLVRAASAAQRVFEIMDLQPDIQLDVGTLTLGPGQVCEVEFCDVHFAYQMRPDKQVLGGLSFGIPAGSTVAIVGRSGAGKTTLVSLLLRFYDPQLGEVLLNGRPLTEYSLRAYQKRVGVVSQETQVFCRPICDNLTYGLEGDMNHEKVVEAACMANADEFIRDLDGDYNAMIGEGGVRLSGGQRQRLAIARALLRQPSLLLLDEATSALDAENEGKVQQSLDALVHSMAGRCSVMLIAHRLSTVMGATKIVVIDGGRVAEQGSHSQLLQSDGLYAQLVQRQLAKTANTLSDSPPLGDADMSMSKSAKGQTRKAENGNAPKAVDSIDGLFEEVSKVAK